MPPFAFLEVSPERLSAFFTYVLSIAGGAVAGYLAAVLLGRLFDRAVLGKGRRSAPTLHSIFRAIAAIAVAVLVAIFFFPGGGGGKGTGDGKEEGPDKPNPTGGPDPTKPVPPTPVPTPGAVLNPDERARAVVRLDILGGSDAEAGGRRDHFYREAGKAESFPLAGVEKLVNERKAGLKAGVGVAIEYRLTRHSKDDPNFQGLTLLQAWGRDNKVSVDPTDK